MQLPSKKNIAEKYTKAIEQVIKWCFEIHNSFNCQIYSVYVRGSTVQDFQTIYSDIDMVVLLKGASLVKVIQFEHTIDTLLALYLYPYIVDVKVYAVNKQGEATPAIKATGVLRNEIKKHINFDLYANGYCYWGQRIPDSSTVFDSPRDFIKNNSLIMGSSILQSCDLMIHNSNFSAYYPLIKKIIKLSAIVNFKEEIGYISTIKACLNYLNKHACNIRNEINLIFSFLEKEVIKASPQELQDIKEAILAIVYIILPTEARKYLSNLSV
jgi:predicted nucleotidyltransferase